MDSSYSYTVKRMRRKSLKLFITDEGEVMVYAPVRVDDSVIESFVSKNKKWIEEHIENVARQNSALEEHLKSIRFLGQDIKVVKGEVMTAVLSSNGTLIVPDTTVQKERRLINDWYRRQAEAILTRRTEHWSEIMELYPENIGISNARKRWGSCSSEKHISYSWRLIAAGRDEIDYVVIHELSHLRYMNHSRAFWEQVGSYCPGYRECEKKLNDLSKYLKVTGWSR
ncbi:MAG: M48 family metallopeptidase [Clostridia bacterium]|nr:M48 family metallopeptidase [Clostridia bacterium]